MSFQDMSYISILLMHAMSSPLVITWFATDSILAARSSARMFQKGGFLEQPWKFECAPSPRTNGPHLRHRQHWPSW